MAVTVTYTSKATVVETVANNTDALSSSARSVTYDTFDTVNTTLNSSSTPPATMVSGVLKTLSGGAAAFDLTALIGTNGATFSALGLKPQIIKVKNLGANPLTILPSTLTGYSLFGSTNPLVIPSSGEILCNFDDQLADVSTGAKDVVLTGTGTQTSRWLMVFG